MSAARFSPVSLPDGERRPLGETVTAGNGTTPSAAATAPGHTSRMADSSRKSPFWPFQQPKISNAPPERLTAQFREDMVQWRMGDVQQESDEEFFARMLESRTPVPVVRRRRRRSGRWSAGTR
ncbi:hypothetical protein N0V88_007683 [Collariella sp. IMI 366227]|nr:hypothetical protein N0V88_007683 [Collariella sp. IMI 366227]